MTTKERLATKMDIMELKGDISYTRMRMKQGFRDQLKSIMLLMMGFLLLIIAAIKILIELDG
jgi:hypothetical protein